MIQLKPVETDSTYERYIERYERMANLRVQCEFLKDNRTYVFYHKDKMIGGFVLSANSTLRTISVFATTSNHSRLYERIKNPTAFCEVCCFWIDSNIRKRRILNILIWMLMANKIRTQKKEFIMYGTNSKGLAYVYGYPKNSVLLHRDNVNDKETFIFIARRRNLFLGTMEIMLGRIFGIKNPHVFTDKRVLQEKILNEIG